MGKRMKKQLHLHLKLHLIAIFYTTVYVEIKPTRNPVSFEGSFYKVFMTRLSPHSQCIGSRMQPAIFATSSKERE